MSDAKAPKEYGAAPFWDVLERSAGGHERRRRLAWRMTEEQALEWESANGVKLIRVTDSELPQHAEKPRRPARQAENDVDDR
jgi:hypothetical protein